MWVSAHQGIEGNSSACEAAKQAVLQDLEMQTSKTEVKKMNK